ncbi:MAG: hypothetical protein AAB579_03805, partial [Patescibacteria group bacterium]
IKDIQQGDEIASLDEQTGKIVWSRVNALMDMGVKQTYRLTTMDGRVIRTTANHPYLVQRLGARKPKHSSPVAGAGWLAVENIQAGDYIAAPKNQKVLTRGQNSLIRWAVDLHHTRVNEPFEFQSTTRLSGFTHQTHRTDIIDIGWNKNNTLISEGGVFGPLMSVAPLTETLMGQYISAENFVKRVAVDNDKLVISLGKEKALEQAGAPLLLSAYGMGNFLSSPAGDNSDMVWAKVASIEKVGEEHVYDIEVEDTHNFIGNDIVAHNTYISSDLSIGGNDINLGTGTATTTISGGFGIGVGTTTPGAAFAVATSTAGLNTAFLLSNLGTGYTMWAEDEANDTSPFVIQADGNVGIGTTTPGSLLSVHGNALISGNLASVANITATGTITHTAFPYTSLTASTEYPDVNFNLARSVQFSSGSIATQRAFIIQAPTYSFTASSTLTDASTLAITGAPVAGTLATTTNTYGLRIAAGSVRGSGAIAPRNAYGLFVDAPTGAADNYTAVFNTGNVGIGTSTPNTVLTVSASTTVAAASTSVLALISRGDNVNAAANIGAGLEFRAMNTASSTATSSSIVGLLSTVTAGSEAGDLAFYTRTGGASLQERVRITSLGNLGIGTVSPIQALHVVGQCVTGDTRLRRRRRKSKVQSSKFKSSSIPDSIGDEVQNNEEY